MATELEKNQERINQLEQDIAFHNGRIDRMEKTLLDQGVKKSDIKKFKEAAYNSVNPELSEIEKAKYGDTASKLVEKNSKLIDMADPIQQKASAEFDLKVSKAENTKLKKEEKKTQKEKDADSGTTVSQEGHLYPVELVTNWTNKLKQYNKQLEDFMAEIDSIPVNIDISWLCQKIEAFCRRINYYLAQLRYTIIKGLNKAFNQAKAFTKLIDPIVNFVKPSFSADPSALFSGLTKVVTWVTDVIKFFFEPYMTIIQFIQDFMTYTPPLVSEATKLVTNVATMPAELLSKIDISIQTQESEAKETAMKNVPTVSPASDATPEIAAQETQKTEKAVKEKMSAKKKLANLFKKDINIKMDNISLGEIMSGNVEEPKMEENPTKAQQKDLYQAEYNNAKDEVSAYWDKLKSGLNSIYQKVINSAGSLNPKDHTKYSVGYLWPVKMTKLSQTYGDYFYRTDDWKTNIPWGSAFSPGRMAEEVGLPFFGDTLKDPSKPIPNTYPYPVYKVMNLPIFLMKYSEIFPTLSSNVEMYYTELYGDGNTNKLNSLLPYKEFLRWIIVDIEVSCEVILPEVSELEEAVKNVSKAKKKLKAADQPTAFD